MYEFQVGLHLCGVQYNVSGEENIKNLKYQQQKLNYIEQLFIPGLMNDFKASFYTDVNQLHRHRLAVSERELTDFWLSKTLIQLEKILSIKDQYLIQNISTNFIGYFLDNKKIAPGEAFHVMHKDQVFMYSYDAKLFRNQLYEKYDNDLISTYLFAYRDKAETPNDEVFEFLNVDIVNPKQWIFKVKESAILRIFPYLIHRLLQKRHSSFDYSIKNQIGGNYMSKQPYLPREVVILKPQYYYSFVLTFLGFIQNPQMVIKPLFEILTQIMFNNLLIAWYDSLSQKEKYSKHYKQYFKRIEKPKNKEEFTSIDKKFTQIKWQNFKLFAFKLKYIVKETQNHYECYQKDKENEEIVTQPYSADDLDNDDYNLLKAFYKKKVCSPEYDLDYTTFSPNEFEIIQSQKQGHYPAQYYNQENEM